MQITLLAVGRLRPAFREACDDYLRRIGRFAPVRELEVREAGRARTPALQQREEDRRLRERLPPGAPVIALARTGAPWSSQDLARRLGAWRDGGQDPVFVIGGSTGLGDDLLEVATLRWSLGPLTLPHELARVVVAEQLYRAGTILRGEPYHKGR